MYILPEWHVINIKRAFKQLLINVSRGGREAMQPAADRYRRVRFSPSALQPAFFPALSPTHVAILMPYMENVALI